MGWSLGIDETVHFAVRAANTASITADFAVNRAGDEEQGA